MHTYSQIRHAENHHVFSRTVQSLFHTAVKVTPKPLSTRSRATMTRTTCSRQPRTKTLHAKSARKRPSSSTAAPGRHTGASTTTTSAPQTLRPRLRLRLRLRTKQLLLLPPGRKVLRITLTSRRRSKAKPRDATPSSSTLRSCVSRTWPRVSSARRCSGRRGIRAAPRRPRPRLLPCRA